MSRLASLLSRRAVRDGFCDLLKQWQELELPYDISDGIVESELQRTVVPALGELPGVTVDDLIEAFRAVTDSVTDKTAVCCDDLFKRFSDCLINLADHFWWSEPVALGPPTYYEWDREVDVPRVWQSSDAGLSVFLIAQLPAAGHDRRCKREHASEPLEMETRMYAQMMGVCSRSFFDAFCLEAKRAMSSLLRCINDLLAEAIYELAEDRNKYAAADVEVLVEKALGVLDISDSNAWYGLNEEGKVTPIEKPWHYDSFSFIRDGLAALFTEVSTKKDSMARRLKNAIRLVIESHNQSENAVGLALSVAAIEALLCVKGENLAQMFGENLAALLEPDPEYRLHAERWSKRLYSLRSNVLHGTEMGCSAEDIREARVAAGVVLRALLERRAAVRRVGGEDEKPAPFLEELRSGKYISGQLTHVSELPLKHRWRKDAPKRIE